MRYSTWEQQSTIPWLYVFIRYRNGGLSYLTIKLLVEMITKQEWKDKIKTVDNNWTAVLTSKENVNILISRYGVLD